jgi:hypothetical protein
MADYDKLIKGVEGEIQVVAKRIDNLIKGRKEIMDRGNTEIAKINEQLSLGEQARLQLKGQIQAYEKLRKEKKDPKKTTVKERKKGK